MASASVDTPARPRRRLPRRGARVTPGEPFPLKRRSRSKLPFKRELQPATAAGLIFALTILAAAIRLAKTPGLSLDEIATVQQSHQSFGALISYLIHGGVYPPLYPVLEWCVVHLAGDGNLVVRLPSLLGGIALVPAVAWLADELFDRRTAVVAALFAALAPILVWYAQEASGYGLVALFGTLAIVGAARAIRRGGAGDWALHAVAASLCVWSDWSGIFVVLATELVLASASVRLRREGVPMRRYWAGWRLDTLALACQLVALGVLFASQLHAHGGLAGVTDVSASGVSFYSTVSNVSWALFGFHPAAVTSVLSAIWPLAMLGSLIVIGRGVERRASLLLACAIIPALGVLILGLAVAGSFDVRYFVAAAPPVLVLLARMTVAWPRGRTGRSLVAAGVVLLLAGALVDQQLDRNNPRRYDYGPALAAVQQDARGRAAVLYEPAEFRVVVGHFTPRLHATVLSTHLPSRARARNVFVVTSFSNRPALQHLLNRELGALRATRHLVRFRRYPGVSVWWFR